MNWKLGLCVLLPVLTSASVLFLTKKLQAVSYTHLDVYKRQSPEETTASAEDRRQPTAAAAAGCREPT